MIDLAPTNVVLAIPLLTAAPPVKKKIGPTIRRSAQVTLYYSHHWHQHCCDSYCCYFIYFYFYCCYFCLLISIVISSDITVIIGRTLTQDRNISVYKGCRVLSTTKLATSPALQRPCSGQTQVVDEESSSSRHWWCTESESRCVKVHGSIQRGTG